MTPVAELPQAGQRETSPGSWYAVATLGLLAAILLGLLWSPTKRITADVQVNYNEGWNAYRQQMVAEGVPLYGTPPGLLTGETGYPPLSFHVISWLGRTGMTFTTAGRWLSLISLILTGVFVGLIVRSGGANIPITVFSFLLFEVGIAIFFPSRLGMNDPELFGDALTTAGFYFYVRNPRSRNSLFLSAAAFCLAGFTKQTFLAFPIAVAIDLLLRYRRGFLLWAGAMVLIAGTLMGLVLAVDGRFVVSHWMIARSYSLSAGWHDIIREYLSTFQGILLVGIAWALSRYRSQTVYVAAFAISTIMAFLLAGAAGTDLNICFNAFAAAVVLCGLALTDVDRFVNRWLPGDSGPRVGGALMAALAVTLLIGVPGALRDSLAEDRSLNLRANEFRSAVQFVTARPGAALCESLLVCFEAGKPYEFYALFVRDQIKIGRLKEDEVLQLLATHHFQTIQMMTGPSDSSGADLPAKERRYFTVRFMQELLKQYHVGMRTSQMVVYIPNGIL